MYKVTKTMGIIVAVVGLIASCIGIYGFVTGNLSLSSIFSHPQNTSTAQIQTGQTPIITKPIAHNNGNTGSTGSQTTAQGLRVAPTSFTVVQAPNTSGCSYFPNHGWECMEHLYNTTSAQLNWKGTVPDGSAIVIQPTSSSFIFSNDSTTVDISIPDMSCPANTDITFAVEGGDAAHVHWICNG
jgi:heme/copper-type cytochrome/quinol oxidase subunit 2